MWSIRARSRSRSCASFPRLRKSNFLSVQPCSLPSIPLILDCYAARILPPSTLTSPTACFASGVSISCRITRLAILLWLITPVNARRYVCGEYSPRRTRRLNFGFGILLGFVCTQTHRQHFSSNGREASSGRNSPLVGFALFESVSTPTQLFSLRVLPRWTAVTCSIKKGQLWD